LSGYIKRKGQETTLLKGRRFPCKLRGYRVKKSVALIGVGGNIGDSLRRFEKLFHFLKREPRLKLLATSTLLKNPPFGYLDQEDFYNTLVLVETSLTPIKLLKLLQRIESHFGRKRLFKNAPRTLDLDIIAFNKQRVTKGSTLIVPHPRYQERQSILVPLKSLKGVKWLKRVL